MRPTVLVVGGGYAGTMIAKELDDEAAVILVDPRDAFVNVSCSLRATVRPEWAEQPFFAYSTLLRRGRVIRDAAASVDGRGVTLASGRRVDADYLVLATGSSHSYPARPHRIDLSSAAAAADLRATGEQLALADRGLILGAGPVGLELAGEIRDAYPRKSVTIIDPGQETLPGYLPEVRDELSRQLHALDIELRLNTSLTSVPAVPDGLRTSFTVTTESGETIEADIWFRSFGSRLQTSFLEDGALITLNERRTVPVDRHLNVLGYDNVYAVGDIAESGDAKMATWAQTQAPTVIENIRAQVRGEQPTAEYAPSVTARILLPLGPQHGVGQLPSPDGGSVAAPTEAVIARKGTDLFTARFAERFGISRPAPSALS